MTTINMKASSILALLAMVSFVSLTLAMSIEREPVRVTPQNSGPKYDVDEDKLTPTNPESEQPPTSNKEQIDNNRPTGVRVFGGNPPPAGDQQDPQEAFPIGHMTIRRIFLVPMMSPPRQDGDQTEPAGPNSDMPLERPSPMLPQPLWPFSLSPARHQQPHHHLFGQDEASRPPVDPKEREEPSDNSPAASGEREGERGPPERPMFDPIKMMIDMMQQAIAGQLAPPETSNPGDLNTNEASDKPTSERDSRKPPTSATGAGELDKPMRPTNETKEDIVTIDGKKYLRKTIINRHVGENIIFMTKRLIFTQLNDTDSNESPTTTTTTTTTTTLKPIDEATEIPVKPTASPAEEPTSATSTTPADVPATGEPAVRTEQPTEMSTTTTSEAPASTSAGDQIAGSSTTTTTTTTTTEQPEETTTTKDAAEAAKKAAERLTDSTITTN